MNKYEMLTIFSASLSDEQKEAIVDKYAKLMEKNGGKVESVNKANPWGLRKLAYPVKYKNEGYYVLVNFKSEGTLPSELERIFGITDGIMRSIVIRHEDKKEA